MRLDSLCFLSLLLPVVGVADVVFSDDNLTLSNYSATAVYNSPGVSSNYFNCPSCGFMGIAGLQQVVMTPPNAMCPSCVGGEVFFGLTNNTFVYNPQTQGAIDSLGASVNESVSFDRTPAGGFTYTFWPLIEQGGNYYTNELFGSSFGAPDTTGGYQNISQSGMQSTDFFQVDFPSMSFLPNSPDFSATALPLIFGLAPIVVTNDSFTVTANYSNLNFDIVPDAVATPEPATLVPMGFLALCLFLSSFRRVFHVRLDRG